MYSLTLMKHLDLTLQTPAENLALEEALLDHYDDHETDDLLRFWESGVYFVVLGLGNHLETETHRRICEDLAIPILRRCSGGGTVLQGRGCFNYAFILNTERHPDLQSIKCSNRWILTEIKKSLLPLSDAIALKGISDLAIGDKKFSGNAQRRKRRYILFHGTILIDFDLNMIETTLKMPSLQPDYRQNRRHTDFITNTHFNRNTIKEMFIRHWHCPTPLPQLPETRFSQLTQKYNSSEWNYKR